MQKCHVRPMKNKKQYQKKPLDEGGLEILVIRIFEKTCSRKLFKEFKTVKMFYDYELFDISK